MSTVLSLPPVADRIYCVDVAALTGCHPRSVPRWARRGVGGVRLAAVYVGGRLVTTRHHLEEFMKAVQKDGTCIK